MLQLPPRGQDHRELFVRRLRRRGHLRRGEPRPALGAREPVGEDDGLARVGFTERRVSHHMLPLQPFPRDVVERFHALLHLGENLGRMGVSPVEAKPFGKVHGDRPILPRVTRRRHGGAAHLDLTVGVRHRARLLRPGGSRQDYVGVIRRFRQENVLHHQMVELGERVAGVLHIRVGHGRVFAKHIHAANVPGVHRIHDLNDGQPLLGGEIIRPPDFIKG